MTGRKVTHDHYHSHAIDGVTDDKHPTHGHWHAHDARNKEKHEGHAHTVANIWPHKDCAIEYLPVKR